MSKNYAVILAAGDGKRMKSKQPKVLNEVLFEPMLEWVMTACNKAGVETQCVVAGYEHEMVEKYVGERARIALQLERKGTAHAVMQASDFIKECAENGGNVLVVCGDAPFMDESTISDALKQHTEKANDVTVITAKLADPTGYGRIIRTADGISGIVEQKDASSEQLKIKEGNSGAYWFNAKTLSEIFDEFECNNSQGEYYLTDAIEIILKRGGKADAYMAENSDVVLGANDKRTLFMLHNIAREKVINQHFENGVEFLSLDGVLLGRNVKIGAGTKIYSGTILKGNTEIGEGCTIGANTLVENCKIGDRVVLNSVQAFDSIIENDVNIGPFVHIRPNSHILNGVKIGDFVEIKNSVIGERTAVAHLTYVGDSDVGSGVNFGCGCVTVNYDGMNKHRTTIGDGAFIGCNTNLIAPVTVGEGAYTAAGSTITKDVPAHALAIERAQQCHKEDYAKGRLKKK